MEAKGIKRVFSRIGLGLSLLLFIQQGISAAAVFLLSKRVPELTQNGWYLWAISYIPLYVVAFPVFMLVLRTIPDRVPSSGEYAGQKSLSVKNMILLVCISFGIVYPLNLLSTLLNMGLAAIKGSDVMNPLLSMVESSSPWASLLFVVIIAPVMEELIFRKFLYNKLIQFGGKTYIFFSAFVFAMFHANLYQLLYAFVLGLLLAGIMYYTRDIRYCIILHFIINLFGSGVGIFLVKYANELAVGLYGVAMIIISVTGIVSGGVWWMRRRSSITFSAPEFEIENKKLIWVNFGVLVYVVSILAVMAFIVLM